MPYKLIYELEGGTKTIITFEFGDDQDLGDMLSEYENFLLACGFWVKKGSLQIVDEEEG